MFLFRLFILTSVYCEVRKSVGFGFVFKDMIIYKTLVFPLPFVYKHLRKLFTIHRMSCNSPVKPVLVCDWIPVFLSSCVPQFMCSVFP